ncbi:MAG: hypothetical protein M5U01_15305 [Ardenticatenaceae bacterium]|nr:hypothetical protein [Ardenticatenaceae bacterium]
MRAHWARGGDGRGVDFHQAGGDGALLGRGCADYARAGDIGGVSLEVGTDVAFYDVAQLAA